MTAPTHFSRAKPDLDMGNNRPYNNKKSSSQFIQKKTSSVILEQIMENN